MEQQFCSKCGLKLIEKEVEGILDKYDVYTGKIKVKLICPSGICRHEGVEHIFSCGWFFSKCIKCNMPASDSGI